VLCGAPYAKRACPESSRRPGTRSDVGGRSSAGRARPPSPITAENQTRAATENEPRFVLRRDKARDPLVRHSGQNRENPHNWWSPAEHERSAGRVPAASREAKSACPPTFARPYNPAT
jgi:hypothetical protein